MRLFKAKAEQMGEFPDKIIINALTGTATRHRDDMAQPITTLLESMIVDPNHPAKHKLPICFLVDSIVKNITDPYAELFEGGLVRWFCSAYDVVDEKSKVRALALLCFCFMILPGTSCCCTAVVAAVIFNYLLASGLAMSSYVGRVH